MRMQVPRIATPTYLSLIAGLVFSVIAFVYSETGLMVTVMSFNLTLVVYIAELVLRQIRKLRAQFDAARKVQISIDRIRHAYLRTLAEGLIDECARAVEALAYPTREFPTEAEYFRDFIEYLKRLGSGDWVRVACADLPLRWESMLLKRYVAANYAAVGRGVAFMRIILSRHDELEAIAREQASHRVRVLLLREREMANLEAVYRIPKTMGMGVLNGKRVYIHYGAGPTWYGCVSECPLLAAAVMSVLSQLEAHADAIGHEGSETA